MPFYIETSHGRPVDSREFATVEQAFEAARQPAWAGAGPTEIEVTGPTSYKYMGYRYTIVAGENPKLIRATAASQPAHKPSGRSPLNAQGGFKGGRWLSREMDRADSDL